MKILRGVDLTNIRRITDMVEGAGMAFTSVAWTQSELDFCGGRPQLLATRWAATECWHPVVDTDATLIRFNHPKSESGLDQKYCKRAVALNSNLHPVTFSR